MPKKATIESCREWFDSIKNVIEKYDNEEQTIVPQKKRYTIEVDKNSYSNVVFIHNVISAKRDYKEIEAELKIIKIN